MAKKAILDVLESTIGRFVQELDADSLNIGVWNGEVELHSLQLNVPGINEELSQKSDSIPIRVAQGHLQRLQLQVPWTSLTTRPIVIKIQGLHVVVEPHQQHDASGVVDASLQGDQKRQEARTQALAAAEKGRVAWKTLTASLDDGGDGKKTSASSSSSSSSFGAGLLRRLVENVQVEIEDVHLSVRGGGGESSTGVVLESLSLVTVEDKDGQRTFGDRGSATAAKIPFLYKLLQITGLEIYCNESNDAADNNSNGVQVEMSDHLLSPLSLQVKLRQTDCGSADIAKYQVISELSSLNLSCSRRQLELLHLLALAVATPAPNAKPLFPEYRPSLPPQDKATVKLWWNYARRCIGRLTRRRSWTELFLAFQKRQRFVALYKRQVYASEEVATWLQPLTASEEEELEKLTLDPSISVEGIIIWRNLADAQHERNVRVQQEYEEEQAAKSNAPWVLFSCWCGESNNHSTGLEDDEAEVATAVATERESLLQLSADEFKQLERLASDRARAGQKEAAKDDSLLFNVQFALEALQVSLTNRWNENLTALRMGRVETKYLSRANGAFEFSYGVSTFCVQDEITPRSFFPSVVQTLADSDNKSSALSIDMKKNARGHGDLKLDMVEFRIVASPTLVQEIKVFFDLSNLNPAPEGDKDTKPPPPSQNNTSLRAVAVEATTAAATAVSHQLSAAIADAWTSKRKNKAVWSVSCNIAAPVVVLPESCTDAHATALVLDWGDFQFSHGRAKAGSLPPRVETWFQQTRKKKSPLETFYNASRLQLGKISTLFQQEATQEKSISLESQPLETFYDAGRMQLEKLTLVLGTVGNQAVSSSSSSSSSSNAIIEPMSLKLDIGIEQTTSATDPSRTCVMGVLPTIAIGSSASQVKQIMKVVQTWTTVLSSGEVEEEEEKEEEEGESFGDDLDVPLSETVSADPEALARKEMARRKATLAAPSYGHIDKFHFFLSVRDCSAHFLADQNQGGGFIDAQLVSITTSMTQSTDGSFQSRFCMGWFWVVDRLASERGRRRQRLLVHSKLPRSAEDYAAEGSYDVFRDLQEEEDGATARPSDLANVVVRQCPLDQVMDEMDQELGMSTGTAKATVLKASFHSLFVNCNPLAFQQMLEIPTAVHETASSDQTSIKKKKNNTSKKKKDSRGTMSSRSLSPASKSKSSTIATETPTEGPPVTIIKVQMKRFQFSFRSALDDLPLCQFGVAGIAVNVQTATNQHLVKSSNVSVETGAWSLVLSDWKTVPPDQTSLEGQEVHSFVLQSKVTAKLEWTAGSAGMEGCDVEFYAQAAEVFTAQGFSEALTSPTEVMAPVSLSTFLTLAKSTQLQEEIDVKMVGLAGIAVSFSMQNMALLNSILSSLFVTFELAGIGGFEESTVPTLTEEEVARIEQLNSALTTDDDTTSTQNTTNADSSRHDFGEDVEEPEEVETKQNSRKITLHLTFPSIGCTIINDIFGQEAALLRVAVKNFVCASSLDPHDGSSAKAKPKSDFDINLNASIEADYFDAQTNLWESLLVKPWGLAIYGKRNEREGNDRMTTVLDLESHPCHVSFSEQFLVSLGAAMQMWSVYSAATSKTTENLESGASGNGSGKKKESITTDIAMRKKLAATAARSLLDSLPYTLENHCGLSVSFTLDAVSSDHRMEVPSGRARSFRFERRQRLFGQDVKEKKALYLHVGDKTIVIPDVNAHVRTPPQAHFVNEDNIVVTEVWKRGKLTVVSVRSQVQVTNTTSLPLKIAVLPAGASASAHSVGECEAVELKKRSQGGGYGKQETAKRTVGIPVEDLHGLGPNTSRNPSQPSVVLQISCRSGMARGVGRFELPSRATLRSQVTSAKSPRISELECLSEETKKEALITFRLESTVSVVDGHPVVSLSIRPRAVVENLTPVNMLLRTPTTNTFSATMGDFVVEEWHVKAAVEKSLSGQTVHRLEPFDSIEIYAPGESVDISFMCADQPSAGSFSSWIEKSFVSIPLGKQGLLPEPLRCELPFRDKNGKNVGNGLGAEVFVVESSHIQQHLVHDVDGKGNNEKRARTGGDSVSDPLRRLFLTVKHFVVDHTARVLVEQVQDSSSKSSPSAIASAYSSRSHNRQLSLLPRSHAALRLVSTDGTPKSLPFLVEHVGLAEGGIGSTPVRWSNNMPSGFFAYRTLNAFDQEELHIIPEFVVFNGGCDDIAIKETEGPRMLVKVGEMAPIYGCDKKHGLLLTFEIRRDSVTGITAPIRVDKLGTQVCIVRYSSNGSPLGSLPVQTVMGSRESRLVIKIGALRGGVHGGGISDIFPGDEVRLRMKWSEFQLTLNDTERLGGSGEPSTAVVDRKLFQAYEPVTTITIHQSAVGFERSFSGEGANLESSQLDLIIDNIRIVDCTPGTSSPVVLDLPADDCHLINLCTRISGPLTSDLIKVDSFDLNIGYKKGKANKIVLDTGDDLVWRLINIMNRASAASGELSGVDADLEWNETTGQYNVSVLHVSREQMARFDFDIEEKYNPPGFEQLYDVKALSVSPVRFRISFKRRPDLSPDPAEITNSKVGNRVSHFFNRLKFNIEKADLRFAGYKTKKVKGTSGHLVEIVGAVYISQLKFKLITLLSAVSLQDWKILTSRKGGGDEYLEGDILRMTGNIVGRGSHFLVKGAGTVVGDGVSTLAGSLGDGIQNAAEMFGMGIVGKSVNSAVSGVGEGVGSTVKGVTSGAGTILKETGKGAGQIAGGIGGGVLLTGKGIGKAVKKGDAMAVGTGIGEGVSAVGIGVGQGVETTIKGVGKGVFSAGKGIVSGVKSVGKGLVGKDKKGSNNKKSSG